MLTGWTHRLRGHRLRQEVRHINTSTRHFESGRVEHLLVCNCGEEWIKMLRDPLSNVWRYR